MLGFTPLVGGACCGIANACGPFIVGAVGYVMAHLNSTDWTTGEPLGQLANLARPVPLDYAGGGILGTLMGFWLSGAHTLNPQASPTDEPSGTAAQPDRKTGLPPRAS